jgi:hypothetical protein
MMTKLAKQLMEKFSFPGIPTVSYAEMAEIPDFSVLEIKGGSGVKIPLGDPSHILFRWEMNHGSILDNHKHNCKEIIKIQSGEFLYRGVVYGPGRILHIQKGVPHEIHTVSPGVFYVEFIRP